MSLNLLRNEVKFCVMAFFSHLGKFAVNSTLIEVMFCASKHKFNVLSLKSYLYK